jgi:hypothetical protein
MATYRFGTAINCVDGRVQEPVAHWLKEHYLLDYVDMITEPGADKLLASGADEDLERLRAEVAPSLHHHGSTVLAVVGHHDCAANPASPEEHHEQIRAALGRLRRWNISATLVGLWVGEQWQVEVVQG